MYFIIYYNFPSSNPTEVLRWDLGHNHIKRFSVNGSNQVECSDCMKSTFNFTKPTFAALIDTFTYRKMIQMLGPTTEILIAKFISGSFQVICGDCLDSLKWFLRMQWLLQLSNLTRLSYCLRKDLKKALRVQWIAFSSSVSFFVFYFKHIYWPLITPEFISDK